jgi:hypothetical protein
MEPVGQPGVSARDPTDANPHLPGGGFWYGQLTRTPSMGTTASKEARMRSALPHSLAVAGQPGDVGLPAGEPGGGLAGTTAYPFARG